MLLLAPSGLNEPDPWAWEALKVPVLGEILAKLGTGRSAVAATVRSTYFANTALATDGVIEAMWAPGTFTDNVHATYELERSLDWRVTEAALGVTQTPTLVIWGAQGQVLPATHAARFGALMPDATVHLLEGCGHALTLDCADRVTPLMEEFLRVR